MKTTSKLWSKVEPGKDVGTDSLHLSLIGDCLCLAGASGQSYVCFVITEDTVMGFGMCSVEVPLGSDVRA